MNIHRARELVEGRKDFIIVEKDGYTVADYVFMSNDTFDELERHELRGLKFDNKTGEILARPFHKFFNIGEKEEHANIDWSRPHVVMPKLDGSMIHAALVNNEVRLMTRMGITEHSIRAERHLTDVLKKDFIRTARAKGLPESQVIGRHAFRNSLFPIITLLASVFPRAMGGSLILEIIFNLKI